ncbi:MAG: winged helix-turn-helix domain-containing protein [Candidatus Micrarchaeota archaeon]
MKKKELVYRQMLYWAMQKKAGKFTQLELSKSLRISLSTVNNALSPLEKMGAIDVGKMGFKILDAKKILLYFASIRNLQKDVIYSTRANMPVSQIEKSMPAGAIYTAYSACKYLFSSVPADYSEVYVYADEAALAKIRRRFTQNSQPPNLFVLRADAALPAISKTNIAPLPQIYADLWNLRQWYAKEFVKYLEGKFPWQ